MNDKRPEEKPPSFWRVMLDIFIEGEKDALRFAKIGAILGSAVCVAFGLYFFDVFGWIGVGAGLVIGYVVGGVGAWLMYQLA